ncbi:clusterin-associated protein 1-like [Artemia franciscana]|uniref:Clusterin-associated protein 1 n=1 Tax=Artemia franciscana TaxID=6661 RepID=A0AA88HUD3_ARTSF|nr:hypothetical protein QYM36_012208 [Artemia franciscana]
MSVEPKSNLQSSQGFLQDLKKLGYQRNLSEESYCNFNQPLTQDILLWLASQFPRDDKFDFIVKNTYKDIENIQETEKIELFGTTCRFLSEQTKEKIDPVGVFKADISAVRELSKVTRYLLKSMDISTLQEEHADFHFDGAAEMRSLITDITGKSVEIFTLLDSERDLQEECLKALNRPLNVQLVENLIKTEIETAKEEMETVENERNNVSETEKILDASIERKTSELQRIQQRLAAVRKIRPAYMDDLERIEAELRECQEQYVSKFRSLLFFKNQMEERERNEKEIMNERLNIARRLADRFNEQEYLELADKFDNEEKAERDENLESEKFSNGRNSKAPYTIGSMTGEGINDSDSLDVDSDLSIDENDLSSDDTSDMASELERQIKKGPPSIRPKSGKLPEDDF